MTGTQKPLLYVPNMVSAGPLSPRQLQGLPSVFFFFPFRPRRGPPPMLISLPTTPTRALVPIPLP